MVQRKLKTWNKEEALASFPSYVRHGLKPAIRNVNELWKAKPTGMKNPIILFAVPRALDYVVEKSVLDVIQAWDLLNAELEIHSMRQIGVSHKCYRHLKRIRNKLIAHKVENRVKTPRHQSWYTRAYGSYESVLQLIEVAADKVVGGIERLERANKLNVDSTSVRVTRAFGQADIDALYAALKAARIY